MIKPASLRAAIMAANKPLAKAADSLHIFIDKGSIATTLAGNTPSLCYRYTCTLVLTDYKGHPDNIFVPIIAWCAKNQPDLLLDQSRDPIDFEVEIIGEQTYDIEIKIPLTERVKVESASGKITATHLDAPGYDTYPELAAWQLEWPEY